MTASPIFSDVDLIPFFWLARVPVYCNVLWPTREHALEAPRGDIELGYCPLSGLVWNSAFDEELVRYSPDYETSLHFSDTFLDYARTLVQRLVEKHALTEKTVIEVGSGKGEFLAMLCEAGQNTGIGFDESFVGDPASTATTIVKERFSADDRSQHADLIVSQHVLEHVSAPRDFLGQIHDAALPGATPLYFEVPNGLWTLRDLGVWDVIYEHVAYYTPASLTRLFVACGFKVDAVWTAYDEQFLCIDARPTAVPEPPDVADEAVREVAALCEVFGERFAERQRVWGERLADWREQGHKVAIWGAGSKGVTFLNVVQGGSEIACVIDKNPRKQGRFVPGTGQEVMGPEGALPVRPDRIVVMNPIYSAEIEAECAQLGLEAEIVAV